MPSIISASAEDPEHPNILGASSLKIKVNVSAGCKQDFSSESAKSDEEKQECYTNYNGPKYWNIDSLPSVFFSVAHYPPLTFSGAGFTFAFGVFAHYIVLYSIVVLN